MATADAHELFANGRLTGRSGEWRLSVGAGRFEFQPIGAQPAGHVTLALSDACGVWFAGDSLQQMCISSYARDTDAGGRRRRRVAAYEPTPPPDEPTRRLVSAICRRLLAPACCQEGDAGVEDGDAAVGGGGGGGDDDERPLLLLLNPRSGSGAGLRDFRRTAAPLLSEAGRRYRLLVTDSVGHARRLARDLPRLADQRGIVAVSGDGVLFELLNGLADREDWRLALRLPFAILPAGGGNGVAASFGHAVGERLDAKDLLAVSAFCLAKAEPRPVDLVALRSGAGRRYVACLSVNYGLLADIDISSDRFRALGGARFTFAFLLRLLAPGQLRRYGARLSYLPADDPVAAPGDNNDDNDNDAVGGDVTSLWRHLPPDVATPLPDADGWVTEEAEFAFVLVSAQSHLATDNHWVPGCRPDDGRLYVTFVRSGGMSKATLARMLSGVADGSHVAWPHWHCRPARAFRLEPRADSQLCIDGESVPCEAVQGELLPSAGRALLLPTPAT